MPLTTPDVARALEMRVRRDGSRALIIALLPQGRIELSATTAANWADKITHWLLAEGAERVRLDIAREHPAHWMPAVWLLGCWQAGVVVDVRPDADTDVAVTAATGERGRALTQIACSLHPWGLPLADVPSGAIDMADLRGESDTHLRIPFAATEAFVDETGALKYPQLGGSPVTERVALQPTSARELAVTLADVVAGGSLQLG